MVAIELLRNSQETFRGLEAFLKAYQDSLPVQASLALKAFVDRARGYFQADAENVNATLYSVQLRLMALASIQAELSYKVADFEASARRISERAFSHLQ